DQAFAASSARGMDLLTTVEHEFGHVLNLDHDDDGSAMAEALPPGTRRAPEMPGGLTPLAAAPGDAPWGPVSTGPGAPWSPSKAQEHRLRPAGRDSPGAPGGAARPAGETGETPVTDAGQDAGLARLLSGPLPPAGGAARFLRGVEDRFEERDS